MHHTHGGYEYLFTPRETRTHLTIDAKQEASTFVAPLCLCFFAAPRAFICEMFVGRKKRKNQKAVGFIFTSFSPHNLLRVEKNIETPTF